MRPDSARRLWLALLVLLATLSSSPLGSMEQHVAERGGRVAATESVPVARPSFGLRSMRLELEVFRSDRAEPCFPPLAGGDLAQLVLPAGFLALRDPGDTSLDPPRVCERLPYDANAPPAVA